MCCSYAEIEMLQPTGIRYLTVKVCLKKIVLKGGRHFRKQICGCPKESSCAIGKEAFKACSSGIQWPDLARIIDSDVDVKSFLIPSIPYRSVSLIKGDFVRK
jgi:hypothetical protein